MSVEVCVLVTAGALDREVTVSLTSSDETATGELVIVLLGIST